MYEKHWGNCSILQCGCWTHLFSHSMTDVSETTSKGVFGSQKSPKCVTPAIKAVHLWSDQRRWMFMPGLNGATTLMITVRKNNASARASWLMMNAPGSVEQGSDLLSSSSQYDIQPDIKYTMAQISKGSQINPQTLHIDPGFWTPISFPNETNLH